MLKLTIIETIPQNQQRYPTCGDWQFERVHSGTRALVLKVKVSKTGDYKMDFLLSIHEYVEAVLCYFQGIAEESVDKFDLGWVEHDDITEPGDDPATPYHRQHRIADVIERLIATELGVDWASYEKTLDNLDATL